jgi:hypothetical protein
MKNLIRSILIALPIISLPTLTFLYPNFFNHKFKSGIHKEKKNVLLSTNTATALYNQLELKDEGLSEAAFLLAIKGFDALKRKGLIKNQQVISIADFTKASTEKRLFVIDLDKEELVYKTLVAHGRNSGKNYATNFSNEPSSFKSSLGFYVTGDTYSGKHGYSLHLEGVEKGINDQAFNRAIVIHGAPYVTADLGNQQGYIGRSLGCPALPEKIAGKVIEYIKEGTCLFIYAPVTNYLTKSPILQHLDKGDL